MHVVWQVEDMMMKGNDMTELKPCPFCGSTNLGFVAESYMGFDTIWIRCYGCGQAVKVDSNDYAGISDKAEARAIEAWNRRAR